MRKKRKEKVMAAWAGIWAVILGVAAILDEKKQREIYK